MLNISFLSYAQSKKSEYYKIVNIDSLLQSPVSLPQGKPYLIMGIKFRISTDKMLDIGETGESVKDRFLQFKKLDPKNQWVVGDGSLYFHVGNKTLQMVLSKPEQFHKMIKLDNSKRKEKIIIEAKMLIGKFERYDTSRDFLIQDIQVDDK